MLLQWLATSRSLRRLAAPCSARKAATVTSTSGPYRNLTNNLHRNWIFRDVSERSLLRIQSTQRVRSATRSACRCSARWTPDLSSVRLTHVICVPTFLMFRPIVEMKPSKCLCQLTLWTYLDADHRTIVPLLVAFGPVVWCDSTLVQNEPL